MNLQVTKAVMITILSCIALSPSWAVDIDNPLARDILQELIEIKTTSDIGSTQASQAMADRLKAVGFPEKDIMLLGAHPDYHNLVVRLRGTGSKKPILLIAHLDVVPAPREGWLPGVEPFKLTERDDCFYGRGVLDCKGPAACLIMNLIMFHQQGFEPNRDILVALTTGEEDGRYHGISWLLNKRPDLMDVAYCLNLDADGGMIEQGQRVRMSVQSGEKTYQSYVLETSHPGGHSSVPDKDNAIYRLAAGLTRLNEFEFPYRFNETTQTFFARLAELEGGDLAADMRAVTQDPPDLAAAQRLADASPYYNSLLHTTAVATRLEAGHADNALPQFARAVVNCRLFPGDSPEFVQQTLQEVMADPHIKVTPKGHARSAPASPLIPEVMQTVEQITAKMWPEVTVLPVMGPYASDSKPLRLAGIPTLGVSGIFSELEFNNVHGANERMPVQSYYEGIEFLNHLLRTLYQ